MSATDYADRFVFLKNGPVVPAAPFVLLLDLERRGVRVQADGVAVVVGPPALLTDSDRAALRRWKWHLLMLLTYRSDDSHLLTDSAATAEDACGGHRA